MVFFSFSMILVPLLASSAVSALITPLARDKSLVARHHHRHHHLARQADGHSLARRSARRKRCLHRSTFPASSSPSSSPSSSSYSPAVGTTAATTTSSVPVLDVPINVAPPAPPATTTTTPTVDQPAYTPPPQDDNAIAASSSTGSGETHHGEGTFFDVGLVRAFPSLLLVSRNLSMLTPDFVIRVPAARPAPILTTWLPLVMSYTTPLPPVPQSIIRTLTLSVADRSVLLVSPRSICSMPPRF